MRFIATVAFAAILATMGAGAFDSAAASLAQRPAALTH